MCSTSHAVSPPSDWQVGQRQHALLHLPSRLSESSCPSFLWCNLPWAKKLRKEKGVSYYRFYPESTANWLGSLVTKEPCDLK